MEKQISQIARIIFHEIYEFLVIQFLEMLLFILLRLFQDPRQMSTRPNHVNLNDPGWFLVYSGNC